MSMPTVTSNLLSALGLVAHACDFKHVQQVQLTYDGAFTLHLHACGVKMEVAFSTGTKLGYMEELAGDRV